MDMKNDISLMSLKEEVYVAQRRRVRWIQIIQKKVLPSQESFVLLKQAPRPENNEYIKLPDFQTLIQNDAGCIDTTQKHFLEGYSFLGDKLVSWKSRNKTALQCSSAEQSTGVMCKLCSSNVDDAQHKRL
ncbi:hypothetical protein Tco_0702804 [Tanacetum coccineum]|uniref:Uncharacterized protein n=1 Tax=Tanacetum coccineum TaxID=301880 RepID=A0ABQ4XYX5_9ASTR